MDIVRAGVEEYPTEQAWRIGHALALAMAGRDADARETLEVDPPHIDALLDHVFPFFNAQMPGAALPPW